MTPLAVKKFTQANLPSLKTLDLSHNKFGAIGCSHLCKMPFPELKYLGMQYVGMNAEGLKALEGLACKKPFALEVNEYDSRKLEIDLGRFKKPQNLSLLICYLGGGMFYGGVTRQEINTFLEED